MLKAGAFVAIVPALVLCANLGRLAAEEPNLRYQLPKGTRAIAFKLSKGPEFPEGATPGMAVDIVGQISDPITSGIALVNVRLLAVDGVPVGKEREGLTVTVELTPAQEEVLALMQKQQMKLGMKLREKEKPKP